MPLGGFFESNGRADFWFPVQQGRRLADVCSRILHIRCNGRLVVNNSFGSQLMLKLMDHFIDGDGAITSSKIDDLITERFEGC